jgi:hypothetical protein
MLAAFRDSPRTDALADRRTPDVCIGGMAGEASTWTPVMCCSVGIGTVVLDE